MDGALPRFSTYLIAIFFGSLSLHATAQYRVLFLGDSFVTQGGIHSDVYLVPTPPQWITSNGLASGNGFKSDGSDFGSSSFYEGLVPTSLLFLEEFGVETYSNKNYAHSGGTAQQAKNYQKGLISQGQTSDLVIVVLGANTIATSRTIAAEENDYKEIITDAYNSGTKHVITTTPLTLRADPNYQDNSYDLKTLNYIDMLENLKIWSISQGYGSNFLSIADTHERFGGLFSFSTSDFKTSNIHPSESGQKKLGEIIAEEALTELLPPGYMVPFVGWQYNFLLALVLSISGIINLRQKNKCPRL